MFSPASGLQLKFAAWIDQNGLPGSMLKPEPVWQRPHDVMLVGSLPVNAREPL